jgi:hypothetical protein
MPRPGGLQHLVVGALLDLVDYLAVGLVPILGDIVDLIGVAYFWRVLGPVSLAGLLEAVPGMDVLPTFTALGAYAYMTGGRR